MVFCTCLCLKKHALQNMRHSFTVCKRITTSQLQHSRFYSNTSTSLLLLRQPSPSVPRLINRSLQYPTVFHSHSSRHWRFISVSSSLPCSSNKQHGLKYEKDDMTPIEHLASPTILLQHWSQPINKTSMKETTTDISSPANYDQASKHNLDTTMLTSCIQDGRLGDAMTLLMNSNSIHKGTIGYATKARRLLFTKLAHLSFIELADLLESWMQTQRQQIHEGHISSKRLTLFLKALMMTLPMTLVEQLVLRFPSDYYLQAALVSRYVKNYLASDNESDTQLGTMLALLDTSIKRITESPDTIVRLYNLVLNGCLKKQDWHHVAEVLSRMESSGCSLDTASFNMLIRSRLENDDVEAAKALYEEMVQFSLTPTTATYNTFIKHACQQQRWEDMTLWIDRLLEQHQPNPITLRIMTAALTDHTDQPQVLDAFGRVALMVPVTNEELERTINVSVAQLLRHKHTRLALDILYKLFAPQPNLKDYSLSTLTYNLLIHALAQEGNMEAADQVLVLMRDKKLDDDNNNNNNNIMPMTIPDPDIVSYTSLIHGYIRTATSHDMDIRRILNLYNEIMERGLETNATLQSVVLYGMIKSRFQDIDECASLFAAMVEEDDDNLEQLYDGKMEPKLAKMTMYNMMMDGYFLHQYYGKDQQNSTSKTTTTTTSGQRHIPPEALTLLNQAIVRRLPLTTATMNIWVRGLAIFNHDLIAAEAMVKWMSLTHHVKLNERTIYYLVQTAITQDRWDKARKWIKKYESMGQVIQGTGLQYFKNMVIK
ncbi:uncharacterized protein BX664DRAFT_339791 [Halteromyces radiatus]|uniref:uncharacterized protein n=1 Tax=Halteromyces radiatus TaxID=101107 RepID=UPI00221E4821|nr:uncharacterized protein BX664DRAFT_339791 [Halteromyces radiatus]KAI8083088.1 hypothetical protein BX664DRAFT_339791 [Halteromyces radiatus]